MFKKLLPVLLSFLSFGAIAQNDCSNGRYHENVFPEVLVTPGIPFGLAPTTFDTISILPDSLNSFPLLMDVYQPATDTASQNRPVIVFAFGGAFVYGARVSPDIVQLCNLYAQMGYVAISIDYRLSDELLTNPSAYNATKAVLKGTHDMKAAIRFMRRQATELGNLFRIDTNQIYVGGVSAGAFCAIHAAYLDKESELPEVLKSTAARYGGLEGQSGNPGYSSKVAGVINLCGAIGDTTWIEPGDVPIVSMHGTADGTVPYDADTIRILGINYPVHGSASIHRHLTNMNNEHPDQAIPNAFYTWPGADHVPFVTNSAYMDTTFWFTRDFMYERVCSGVSGIKSSNYAKVSAKIFPNPASDQLKVVMLSPGFSANLMDASGRVLKSLNSKGVELEFSIEELPKGMYFLNINGSGTTESQKITKE